MFRSTSQFDGRFCGSGISWDKRSRSLPYYIRCGNGINARNLPSQGIKILIGIFHYRSFLETLTMASTISASTIKAPVAARQQTVLTQSKTAKPAMVSNVNAKKTNAFLVWTPTDNKVCSHLSLASFQHCTGADGESWVCWRFVP